MAKNLVASLPIAYQQAKHINSQSISIGKLFCKVVVEFVYSHSYLAHSVSVTDGDGVVLESVEVDGYAERRSYLVLTAVSFADGA